MFLADLVSFFIRCEVLSFTRDVVVLILSKLFVLRYSLRWFPVEQSDSSDSQFGIYAEDFLSWMAYSFMRFIVSHILFACVCFFTFAAFLRLAICACD